MIKLLLVSSVLWSVGQAVTNSTRSWEEMLPCRDGVELHTRIILPREEDSTQQTYTTIVDRSPYGYDNLEWIADIFLPFGYATVGQDMRGTMKSEGRFTIWHMDANDSQDLGDWIVQQPWSNGIVYTFGASADGLAAFTTTQNKPTWLGAQYFIWASSIGYDVFYPGGTMVEELIDSWIHGTVDGTWAEVCYESIRYNEMRTDWWIPVEMTNQYKELVKFPAAFWAGWYDIFLVGNLAAYQGYNYEAVDGYQHRSVITIDPLGHCQSAAEYFPQNLIAGRTLLPVAQAYEVFGIFPVQRSGIKNVTFYVMSSNDESGLSTANYWTSVEEFPTPTMTKFYLHSDGSASTSAPSGGAESTTYVYDPANPVPTVGGNNLDMPCGPLDQAEVDARSDVLKYETEVLSEPLAMTGPLFATLYVSSDAIDTDFMVKMSDVYPTGEARLIQDSAVRMRWREGGLEPVFMEAGEVYEVTASLWNTSYVIAPGHKLRLTVTSSNSPRFSVNRNNGVLLRHADPGPIIVANNVLYHSEKYPSHFSLPIVSLDQLPIVQDIKAEFEKAYPQVDADQFMLDHPHLLEDLTLLHGPQ